MSERMTGRVLSVWDEPRGTTLTADAAAGALVLAVDDVSAFDVGGTVLIAAQRVVLTSVDDDASTVTLADPLAVAAEADDSISAWSTLYEMVDTVGYADVAAEGELHNPDPITAVIADGVDLAPGDRGGPGETVVLERDGDEWVLIRVPGKPSKAAGIKFEANDAHTLTAADIAAGWAGFPLSHRPSDEALEGYWEGVRQGPGEFIVNYDDPSVTWPLSGFEAAGDVLGVHYAYRAGIVTPELPLAADALVGTTSADLIPATSIAVPAAAQVGDLFVLAVAANISSSCTDARIDGSWKNPTTGHAVFWGRLDTLAAFAITASGDFNWASAAMSVYRGAEVAAFDGRAVAEPAAAAGMGDSAGVAVVTLWRSGTNSATTAADSTGAYTARTWENEGDVGATLFDWFPGAVVAPNPAGSFATNGTPGSFYVVTLRLRAAA